MRKKSHISLSRGIIHGLEDGKISHKLTFCLASIWPDCTPSFLVQRHCIDDTFELFQKKMDRFIKRFKAKKNIGLVSTFRMGVITHYLADYFTFPHNSHYEGGFKEHCIYEEELKHRMYSYIRKVKNGEYDKIPQIMTNVKQVNQYVQKKHNSYMELEGNTLQDCDYSFTACLNVVASLIQIAQNKNQEHVYAY
ncbi:MAG: hypothetical protein E7258_06690 [Lachnospiraceae bacterium]|nr:hypothetical protein [Lachnospiraceae bacterium]